MQVYHSKIKNINYSLLKLTKNVFTVFFYLQPQKDIIRKVILKISRKFFERQFTDNLLLHTLYVNPILDIRSLLISHIYY